MAWGDHQGTRRDGIGDYKPRGHSLLFCTKLASPAFTPSKDGIPQWSSSPFPRRCAVQACRIVDNAPEQKGDFFAMSVHIGDRQCGAQMREHLVERGTWARRLIRPD